MKVHTPLLLALSVGLAMTIASNTSTAATAAQVVAKKAAVLERLHKKARKSLVNAAQDKTFDKYFATTDEAEKKSLKERIEAITLKVQSKFNVAEMCLIDHAGPELTRIVGNEVAHDLSPDESGAPFFEPALAKKPRQVYISSAYMSVDANKWVLSYTTPVVSGGKTAGILHFEHGLEVFQHVLNREMGQTGQYILAVEDSGWIVSDSRGEIAIAKQGESEDHSNYFKKFSLGGLDIQALKKKVGSGDKGTGKVSEGGTDVDVSYKVIGTWTIVVVGNA